MRGACLAHLRGRRFKKVSLLRKFFYSFWTKSNRSTKHFSIWPQSGAANILTQCAHCTVTLHRISARKLWGGVPDCTPHTRNQGLTCLLPGITHTRLKPILYLDGVKRAQFTVLPWGHVCSERQFWGKTNSQTFSIPKAFVHSSLESRVADAASANFFYCLQLPIWSNAWGSWSKCFARFMIFEVKAHSLISLSTARQYENIFTMSIAYNSLNWCNSSSF